MGSLTDIISGFQVLDDTKPDDMSLPAFMVSKTRGFLPRMDPIIHLPEEFDALEALLARMPVKTASGDPGLLAEGKLGEAVLAELPDLRDVVDKFADNLPLVNALYRDYSFLASAYLLEPCHSRFLRGEAYGLGRQALPANIARPIVRCAEICGFKPFMEYAGSYALFNYRLADPSQGLSYANLRLIRAFEHGLDPSSSEAGFVLVHVDMARHSGALVSGACAVLDACEHRDRAALHAGLRLLLTALERVNAAMEAMWARSRPRDYTSFRTFIFGITAQSMFPTGVVYEGVGGDGEPRAFRGESGANDSMVPLVDELCQIPMPDTPLTAILRDFRDYRPSNHRAFLAHVRRAAAEWGVKEFALGGGGGGQEGHGGALEEGRESVRLWLRVLDQVRDFRWRHWCFGKEYILKRTRHPTATGGSPVVTWLPNQLQAVLVEMAEVYARAMGGGGGDLGEEIRDMMDLVYRQQEMLRKEVERYCDERGVDRG